MQVLQGIPKALPGERVLLTVPALAPYVRPTGSDGAEAALRKRLNLFAQRALTHVALTDEQRSRIADAKLLGRSVAPGVVQGFEVALEGAGEQAALVLMPGHAIASDGSDIELAYPLRVPYRDLPVFAPEIDAVLRAIIEADPTRDWNRLNALEKLVSIARLGSAEINRLDLLPHAMVLVAMPRTVAIDRSGEIDSPCPNATDENVFSELAWEDGFLLAWVPWPKDASLPPWTADGTTMDPRFRNRLAYAVFNNERERASIQAMRSIRVWNERAKLSDEQKAEIAARELELSKRTRVWPWETLGVPLAIVGFDDAHHPVFADRNAVVRQGGGRRNRAALVARAGDDALWQARVAQLVEHLGELPPDQRNAANIAKQFDWLPPAGVVPKDSMDLIGGRQFVFPPNFDVQVQPVPVDMVDTLLNESAPLLPFNLSLRDQVQVLVPVESRYYEPDLLKLDEKVHPLFAREIARLETARVDLLSRRDALRRRFDVLNKTVTGAFPDYPQDDPESLPDETGAADAIAFARVHVSAATGEATEEHGFFNAASRLKLQTADALFVFVRVDTPPPAISIELDTQETPALLPLVWGAQPPANSALWMGPLPKTGEWTRLVVPLAQLKRDTLTLVGMRFGIAGGSRAARVTWGYAGRLSNGVERYWLSDAIPAGATTQHPNAARDASLRVNEWTWEVQAQGAVPIDEDTRYGLPITGIARDKVPNPQDVREVAEIEQLVAGWLRQPGGLVRELGVDWPAIDRAGNKLDANGKPIPATSNTPQKIEPSDQPPLIEQGLDAFIARMNARIAASDDHVEFGFLRARTDIFRVRQGILGSEKAGQLLTSPAASELVQRSTSIAATEKEFDDYFKRAKETRVPPPPSDGGGDIEIRRTTPGAAPSGTGRVRGVLTGTGMFNASATIKPMFTATSTFTSKPLLGARVISGSIAELDASLAKTGVAVEAKTAIPIVSTGPTTDDVTGSSLYAATFNTVTVGKRLEGSAAVETKNASATGKTGFVTNSLTLLQTTGVSLHGIDVYGFKDKDAAGEPDPTVPISAINASKLLAAGKLFDFDAVDPGANEQHEAGYFTRGLEAIDSMVRFLRGVEMRAEDYRRLQRDAIAARARIVQVMAGIERMLASLAARIAEARHDLSVARALLAEEQARVQALIAKRKTILTEQVPYLVFRRPRLTNTLVDTQVLQAQPSEVDDPVPRCRAQHDDIPVELQAMVDTLKDVPARWFKHSIGILTNFKRIDHLQRIAEVARERLMVNEPPRKPMLVEGDDTKTGMALMHAFDRHAERVAVHKNLAIRELTNFSAISVKQAITPLRTIASLGDLIRAFPPARDVTLSAAGLLDDIAGVAGCLYTAFGQVPPATRLIWAERFSQLDAAASMRALTVLPGFGDETLGVDFIVWRGMQRMVDWLYASVENDGDAIAAIDDLVRVCVLLSAHAPVKRIITARVRVPVKPIVGAMLDLAIDPRIARLGMQVLVHAPATNTVVARAVVDDLSANGANARITQVMQSAITIDASMRVQLQSGPALSSAMKALSDARA
ncbi:MAG TPA: hypothetical protein VFS42_03970 [Burkholderiaceae bacterium]|nr:hypothetical protein [Burkholderiaceae bacterium]